MALQKNGRNPFIFAGFGDVRSKNVETHARNNYEKRALDRDLADREQGFEIGDIMVLFEDGKIVITRDGKKPQNVAVTNFPDTIILCSEDMERIC